jgi:hypothetical protein
MLTDPGTGGGGKCGPRYKYAKCPTGQCCYSTACSSTYCQDKFNTGSYERYRHNKIFDGESSPISATNLSKFELKNNNYPLKDNNDQTWVSTSVDGCATRCLNESRWTCRSFDHKSSTNTCILSKALYGDPNVDYDTNMSGWNYYQRKGESPLPTPTPTPTPIDTIREFSEGTYSIKASTCATSYLNNLYFNYTQTNKIGLGNSRNTIYLEHSDNNKYYLKSYSRYLSIDGSGNIIGDTDKTKATKWEIIKSSTGKYSIKATVSKNYTGGTVDYYIRPIGCGAYINGMVSPNWNIQKV